GGARGGGGCDVRPGGDEPHPPQPPAGRADARHPPGLPAGGGAPQDVPAGGSLAAGAGTRRPLVLGGGRPPTSGRGVPGRGTRGLARRNFTNREVGAEVACTMPPVVIRGGVYARKPPVRSDRRVLARASPGERRDGGRAGPGHRTAAPAAQRPDGSPERVRLAPPHATGLLGGL